MDQIDQNLTRTENGAQAYSAKHFLKSEQDSLVAFNAALVNKDNFEQSLQFLENIMVGDNNIMKVYAMVMIVYTRDIEFGKGLRKPFLQGIEYLYGKGYQKFVLGILKDIPKFGYYKDLCNIFMWAEKEQLQNVSDKVTNVYIEGLKREYDEQNASKMNNCAKFAPRQQKKYDKFAKNLASTMFQGQKDSMKQYRKYVGEIMIKYKQITEILMSAKKWDEIDPKYVPSICFQRYKKCFLKEQDDEKRKALKQRYEEHIQKAVEQKDGAKINAKRLSIDQVTSQILGYGEKTEIEWQALEAQMIDIINDLKKSGEGLKNCLAVCDVSGSMSGNPMNACIGLGVAINALNSGKYSKSLITFDTQPQWIDLRSHKSYVQQVKALQHAPWGGSTDFYKAMQLVSSLAKRKEDLPKAIFVFSDMQFNSSGGGAWNSTYQQIVTLYRQRGFNEDDIPTIIFWNLRSTGNFVVDANQKKVIQISGFSQNLIKNITSAPDIQYLLNLTPFTFLLETLNNKRYEKVFQLAMECISE